MLYLSIFDSTIKPDISREGFDVVRLVIDAEFVLVLGFVANIWALGMVETK